MERLKTFQGGVGAGIVIAIGATIYMSCANKIVGAFLFAVGLFCICVFGLNLFTGKIGYLIETKNKPDCFMVWLGNLCGCLIAAVLVRLAKPDLADAAELLVASKLDQKLWQTVILGIFCGILMYIAVESFKSCADPVGKYAGIFLCVPTFILCGFEHSVADMVYFSLGVTNVELALKGLVYILIVSVSNGIGAIGFRLLTKKKA